MEGWGPREMEACGQEGLGPTWAVAPTRRRRRGRRFYIYTYIYRYTSFYVTWGNF